MLTYLSPSKNLRHCQALVSSVTLQVVEMTPLTVPQPPKDGANAFGTCFLPQNLIPQNKAKLVTKSKQSEHIHAMEREKHKIGKLTWSSESTETQWKTLKVKQCKGN